MQSSNASFDAAMQQCDPVLPVGPSPAQHRRGMSETLFGSSLGTSLFGSFHMPSLSFGGTLPSFSKTDTIDPDDTPTEEAEEELFLSPPAMSPCSSSTASLPFPSSPLSPARSTSSIGSSIRKQHSSSSSLDVRYSHSPYNPKLMRNQHEKLNLAYRKASEDFSAFCAAHPPGLRDTDSGSHELLKIEDDRQRLRLRLQLAKTAIRPAMH